MRNCLAFLLIVLCSTSLYAQKKKVALRNQLKSEVVYEQKFASTAGKSVKESETKFDTQGNIVEEIEYENGKIKKHMTYLFDDDGNKTSETELDSSGKTVKKTEFKYNDDGKKIKELAYGAAGKLFKTIEYKYNGELKAERIVYDENNKMKSKKTYQYQTY
jgi:antitoxin component YwqK of YwqJK toxin-antitoxin module